VQSRSGRASVRLSWSYARQIVCMVCFFVVLAYGDTNAMSRKDVLQRTPSSLVQPQGGSGPFGSFVKKNKVEAAINKKIQPAGWASAIKTALSASHNEVCSKSKNYIFELVLYTVCNVSHGFSE